MTGWLVTQLPRAMVADPVLLGFATAFEEVADTVRARIDSIEHQVDAGLASPEMLQFLASWLGLVLEPTDPPAYRRALVREVGRLLGWRGTRHGIEGLLEAATGARVTVVDGGGIYGRDDPVPPADPVVKVSLDHTGHLSEAQVRGFLEGELPLGAQLELDVRYPAAGPTRGRARVRPPGEEGGGDA
ncbi:phage tail protein [Phytohabitans sp. LJ34]|uniref:phage tail protein n=1 Tax=Phytohabitans sp. LJ34 TaxID=3452217 RepID=UPI003F8C75A9